MKNRLIAAVAAVAERPPYQVTAADLAAYGIRNDGDIERIVHVGTNGASKVVKEKRAGVPGYTVTVPMDPKTGEVDASDAFRFTTDFADFRKITSEKGRRRLQISKHLGYQGRSTRSWQMTVCWYDAEKKFISSETAWQYREMRIPELREDCRDVVFDRDLRDDELSRRWRALDDVFQNLTTSADLMGACPIRGVILTDLV